VLLLGLGKYEDGRCGLCTEYGVEVVQDLEGPHRVDDLKTFAPLSSKKVEIYKCETMQAATNRTKNNLVLIS
jgi:hypothetical protein